MTLRRVHRAAGLGLGLVVVLVGAAVAPAMADHQIQHIEPAAPAVDKFAEDVPRLVDDEWGIPIGGFGGIEQGAPLTHAPVIFVHGNVVDHADWYPVRDDFLAAGWTMQELWALSYNGMGNGSGSSPIRTNPERDEDHAGTDGMPRGTNNDTNVPDLVAFVRMVQAYTGSDKVHLVGHSLGVTVIRKTMFVHPDLAADVVSVVGIAGANHGTSLCAPGSEGRQMSCDEIALGTPWLTELNGPDGSLETYGDTAWLTVYDGTGAGDVAFVGPDYGQSPRLLGAENAEFANVDHNGLRMGEEYVTFYREWLESVDAAVRVPTSATTTEAASGSTDPTSASAPAPAAPETAASPTTTPAPAPSPSETLPVTGGAGALGALLMAAAASRRRRSPARCG